MKQKLIELIKARECKMFGASASAEEGWEYMHSLIKSSDKESMGMSVTVGSMVMLNSVYKELIEAIEDMEDE